MSEKRPPKRRKARKGEPEGVSWGMRALALFPIVFVSASFLGLAGSVLYDHLTADRRALEECKGDGGLACERLLRAWWEDPLKQGDAWRLSSAKCAEGVDLRCGDLVSQRLATGDGWDPPAERTLEVACDKRSAYACSLVAILLTAKEPARSREFLERACGISGGSNCYGLAQALLEGQGGPVDRERGMKLLEASCAMQPSKAGIPEAPSQPCERLARERLAEAAPR